MASTSLAKRLSQLEREVADLKMSLKGKTLRPNAWLDEVAGTFANDPAFIEAMRIGRQYRDSLDKKPRKRKSNGNGHSRH